MCARSQFWTFWHASACEGRYCRCRVVFVFQHQEFSQIPRMPLHSRVVFEAVALSNQLDIAWPRFGREGQQRLQPSSARVRGCRAGIRTHPPPQAAAWLVSSDCCRCPVLKAGVLRVRGVRSKGWSAWPKQVKSHLMQMAELLVFVGVLGSLFCILLIRCPLAPR